ncbi:MAG TPA: autotransporter domain-containing protein [Candidatus Omnitrophota bacterium]|nr:autotransporter domain-containing protein [Candidatus Omnitrophota bacterium]HPS36627.1 autotransporter domain-containing protein [Candidatus Omnitrophota bacterium]
MKTSYFNLSFKTPKTISPVSHGVKKLISFATVIAMVLSVPVTPAAQAADPIYFYSDSDYAWETASNWFSDYDHTILLGREVNASDDVIFLTNISIAGNTTINTLTSDTAPSIRFSGATLTATNGAYFYGSSLNFGTVTIATFADTSYNNNNATIGTFNGTSTNGGSVTIGTFNDSSSNAEGNVTVGAFNDSSRNGNVVTGYGFFGPSATNFGSVGTKLDFSAGTAAFTSGHGGYDVQFTLTGETWSTDTSAGGWSQYTSDHDGVYSWVFNDLSVNSSTVTGNATFGTAGSEDDAYNQGSVQGTATLYGRAMNWGSVGTGYFYDHSSNFNGTVTGNATFNNSSKNEGGTVTGNAIFNDTSANHGVGGGDGTVTGTAFFAETVDPGDYGNYGNAGGIPYIFQGTGSFVGATNDVQFTLEDGETWTEDTSGWDYTDGDLSWVFNGSSQSNGTINGSVTFNLTDPTAGDQTGTINAGAAGTVTGDFRTVSGITFQSGTVSSNIKGSGGVTKDGDDAVTLSGANTYDGATTISHGTLRITSATGLGSTVGATSVGNGGTLDLNGTFGVGNEGLTLAGGSTLSSSSGTNSMSGQIQVTGTSTVDVTTALTLSGSVIGSSGAGFQILDKTGEGTLTLSGSTDNTSLATTVDAGTLVLAKTGAGFNATSRVVVNDGTLRLNGTNNLQIWDGATVTLNGGTFDQNGKDETIGTLILAGGAVSGSGTLTSVNTIDAQSGSSSTILAGDAGLTKTTSGTVTLSGANMYTGATNVNAGTLVVDGSIAESSLTTVQTAGTLSGTGTTGDLTIASGGTLAPGNSPGTLTTAGNVTYSDGGTYTWEIANAVGVAGTNWDLQNITGGVGNVLTIASTPGVFPANTFEIDITATGALADFNKYQNYTWTIASASGGISGFATNKFTLADGNFTGTNSIACTGAGCTNGSFSISFVDVDNSGGSPDLLQVVYTGAVNTPANPISWKGGTSTAWNYHTAGGVTNWVNGSGTEANAIPGSTSDVHFYYTDATNLDTTLGQDFTINSLTMNAGTNAVSISGNTLTLNSSGNAINLEATAGALTVNSNVVLGASQTWLNGSSNTLSVAGNVNNGTHTLTVDGSGATAISGAISNGALTKTGSGMLTLSGNNTYAGGTNINGGTLRLGASGVLANDGAVTIANAGSTLDVNGMTEVIGTLTGDSNATVALGAGALTVTQGADATYAGVISGTAASSFVKAGGSKLTLSGANTYSGGTTVSAGVLNIQNNGALGSGSVSVTGGNVAGLQLQGGIITTNANALSLASYGISDSGALQNVSGDNNYTGLVTLSADTGIKSDSGTLTLSNAGTITGAGFWLTVGGAGNTTINSVIGTGTGKLIKNDEGTLTLSGANTYTGTTSINAGTVQVSNAGALGTGAAAHVTNGATLDIGTTALAVGGNYAQTGTLKLTADSTSSYGSITAGGTGNLAGVIDLTVNGYIPNGGTLSVLTSTGALTYDTATTINVLGDTKYTFTGTKSGNILILTASRAENGFASDAPAGNGNAGAVGDVLDNITGASGDMLGVLNTLDGESSGNVGSALETMTPDMSSGTMQASQQTANQFLGSVSNRLGYGRTGGEGGVSTGDMLQGTGFWYQALGSNIQQGTRKGIEGFNANVFGTSIGADKLVDDHIRLGAAGGYGFSNVNAKTPGSPSDDINSWQATLYGSYDSVNLCKLQENQRGGKGGVRERRDNAWYVDSMFGFTENNYDSRREIWLTPATKRVAKSDHHGQQYSTKLESGYTFLTKATKDLEVTPFASLQYSYLNINKYKEDGAGALNLTVQGEGYNELLQALGTKFAYPFVSKKVGTFLPAVKAAWMYDYIGDQVETTASFAGGGNSFVSKGAKPAKSGLLLGGELAFLNKGNMTLTANYDMELKDEFISNTYYGTARFDF